MARIRYTLGFVLAALLPGLAHADTARSPFMPPNSAPSGPNPADPNSIELRGIMATQQGTKYNIYNPQKKTSVWVGVNEPGYNFTIKSGDPGHDSVVVASGGQQMTLALKQPKTATGGIGIGAGGLPPGGVVLRPTSADEAVRLQAVADEVRRRRLLREQAATQQQQGGQPTLVVPQGQAQTGPQGGAYTRRNRQRQ